MKQKDFILQYVAAYMAAHSSDVHSALMHAEKACRDVNALGLLEYDEELANNRKFNDKMKSAVPV